MNWEAITAVAELLGVIAVVISLVYVAHEVRSNTRAMQASAGFDSAQGMASLPVSAVLRGYRERKRKLKNPLPSSSGNPFTPGPSIH